MVHVQLESVFISLIPQTFLLRPGAEPPFSMILKGLSILQTPRNQ